ncbi:unannotated protein [freshwater metagenome]|uniref:Unannotated protein n=1 Tax=freshwater metagenome TaxID=449393 RepID=A0A6J7DXM2_9ZZZZ|nr:hypothetical protein [Actinomycetota bacterium]
MTELLTVQDAPELEWRRLPRTRTADHCTCGGCGRRPLIGETVHRFGSKIFCELCRLQRGGEPDSSTRVRHAEFGASVRTLGRAA